MTHPPKSRTRPLLREADFAARGRRLAERKAQDHLRACEHRDARGEVKIWVWVSVTHAELIRSLVPVLGAALDAGCPPRQMLFWEAAGARAGNTTLAKAGPPVAPDREEVTSGWSDESGVLDDPAAWQGSGLKARRRAQSRRAAARKKAQGLKRVSFVVSKDHKATITSLISEIIKGLKDGLVPRITKFVAAGMEVVEPLPEGGGADTNAEGSGTRSAAGHERPQVGKQHEHDTPEGREPGKPADDCCTATGPTSRSSSAGSSDSGHGARTVWIDTAPSQSVAEGQASLLFDDIKALDRLGWLKKDIASDAVHQRRRRKPHGTEVDKKV